MDDFEDATELGEDEQTRDPDVDADADADPNLAWELLGTAIDYSCPGFDVRRDDVRLPDGTESDYHYVDEPPAVVVLPFTNGADGEEVVVIEEWRQAVGRVSRGLPAGTTEDDDADLETAAHRELTEETGYEADEVEPLFSAEPINGVANAVHHYFVARGCTPTGSQDLDFNETIRVSTTPYDALVADALDGAIRDGRTLLGVFGYELRERRA
jgi:ADP-ribose pyrophosphatase